MKTTLNRFLVLLLGSLVLTLSATGCRTIRGVGQDIDHAGRHLQRATGH